MQLNYLVWMLLAMQWIFSVTTTGNAPGPSCCTKTSKNKVRVTEIVEYVRQDKPICPTKAVWFLLRNNKTICSKPDDPWAIYVIQMLGKGITSSWSSTSRTEMTTSRPSSRPSTEGTITMTTPKGSSTTWKARTSITPGNTNKPPQMTTTQIIPTKMTASAATTTTEGKPSTTNIKATSTSMTTESPVTMTATTLRPRTTVTQRYSTEQSTKAQTTTFKVTSQMTTSLSTMSTQMTSMTTENRVTMKAPRGTSTTESPVKKLSTSSNKSRTTTCVPVKSSSTGEKKKLPWTVRRLRKKTKSGLRRAQMNLKVNIC